MQAVILRAIGGMLAGLRGNGGKRLNALLGTTAYLSRAVRSANEVVWSFVTAEPEK
jgi:hypothetical protein